MIIDLGLQNVIPKFARKSWIFCKNNEDELY